MVMDPKAPTYQAVTDNIQVQVQPHFFADQSNPAKGQYFWIYQVSIANDGDQPVTLKSRYWHITNAYGSVEEVEGEGVVGEQPTIGPGECYRYGSGCPLNTPSGIMRGHYVMKTQDGRLFNVKIPPFSLDSPYEKTVLN